MPKIKEKKERALGAKLFLKAERSSSPKSALVRRPYPPGMHGQKRRKSVSEYGKQLKEKQKLQLFYGLRNKTIRRLFKRHSHDQALVFIERRLDNVLYLLGFAGSNRIARQLVSHGHITVNNKKVTIASYQIKKGDIISVRKESQNKKIFSELQERLKSREQPPSWLKVEPGKFWGECAGNPELDQSSLVFDVSVIGEFYSR